MTPLLHTYFRSSAAFRVRIALGLKGLDYTPKIVQLPRGEHRAAGYATLNPQALVPTLEIDGAALTQSLAILEYFEEIRPEPRLLPREPAARAWVRSLSLLVACEIHPLNNLRVLQHLRGELKQDEAAVKRWYQHWVAEGLVKFEAQLAQAPAGSRYCYGAAPGMADCCLVPQIFNAQRFDCDLAAYPRTTRVFDACMALEAFQKASPAAQPDAQ